MTKSGWKGEPRRHSLARKGVKTVLPDGKRFDVSKFVANGKSEYYNSGYLNGSFSAEVNIQDNLKEIKKAFKNDEIGEIVGQIREMQTQYAGDISYDVMYDENDIPNSTRNIKISEYEEWENGFYQGFYDTVKKYLSKKRK